MKIAVNCSYFILKGGGIKEYIYNLVTNLNLVDQKNQYIYYILKDQEDFWKENFGSKLHYKIIPFEKRQRVLLALFSKKYWKNEQIKEKFDIFHSPFFHIPSGLSCKIIITVHDLRFMKYPNSYEKLRLVYLKYAVPKSLKKANHIITISEFTKTEILRYFKTPSQKITTVHEAIDNKRFNPDNVSENEANLILKKYNLKKQNYILSVSHIEPRKNYERLIKAFLNIKDKLSQDYKLVIVGKKNLQYEKILQIISENENSIQHLDFIEEQALMTLYKNAKLFAFPSYYEGFGFPPLEAAAYSVPSVASNVSSVPEICGKGAHYFMPLEVDDISKKILEILNNSNLYEEKKKQCIQNLKRFSWKKNAEETIKIYNSIIE